MAYCLFYNIVRLGSVEADECIPVELDHVRSDVFPLLKEDGEYFGLVDSLGMTLQVLYGAEKDAYWVEIPDPERRGSYGISLSFDEASDFIARVEETIPKQGYPEFRFSAW